MNQAQPAIKTMSKKTTAANKLDPIAVLREELTAAAVCHGVERVEDLTEALVSRYVDRLGGSTVYVRNPRVMERERIAKEVRAKFNGRNTRALAREYGVSVRWVQRLLGERRVLRVENEKPASLSGCNDLELTRMFDGY